MAHDIDNCLNAQGEIINADLGKLVERLNTCTEISPSGVGLRLFLRGKLEVDGELAGGMHATFAGFRIEFYQTERYVTITGNRFADSPDQINECPPDHLDWLRVEYLKKHPPGSGNGYDKSTSFADLNFDTSEAAQDAFWQDKLEVQYENNLKFRATWDVKSGWYRADKTPNWSDYDMFIGGLLVRAGYTDQEIYLAIIMFRRLRCNNNADRDKPFARRYYLAGIIRKARAFADAGQTEAQKEAKAEAAKLPAIQVFGGSLARNRLEAESASAQHCEREPAGGIYQRGGHLVRIHRLPKEKRDKTKITRYAGTPQITQVESGFSHCHLASVAK
jgi:hypothetical protein